MFNSGRLDGWTVHDEGTVSAPSKWQVVNYQLKQSSNIYGGSTARSDIRKPGSNIIAGNAAWKNYDFSVRMRTYDDDGVGVVFRYADKNNHYRFSMDRQRGYQRLVKKVNGVYTLLAQNSRGYACLTWIWPRGPLHSSRCGTGVGARRPDPPWPSLADARTASGRRTPLPAAGRRAAASLTRRWAPPGSVEAPCAWLGGYGASLGVTGESGLPDR